MYVEYAGIVTFSSEEGASKAREILKEGKWVKQVGEKLAYVDDGNTIIEEDSMYTPDSGLTVYLNGGVLENINRAVSQMLELDVDKEKTNIASVSFDGGVYFTLYNKDKNSIEELPSEEVQRILGYDPLAEIPDEEKRMDAEENGYDWVTEYIVDVPEDL